MPQRNVLKEMAEGYLCEDAITKWAMCIGETTLPGLLASMIFIASSRFSFIIGFASFPCFWHQYAMGLLL
jgi:hypothetical protein